MSVRWLWFVVVPSGIAAGVLLAYISKRAREREYMSDRWLFEYDQREHYNTFDGVNWRWPIKKTINEHGEWNAHRLKKRA